MTVEALGRGFRLYRRSAVTRSVVALLVANAIPVVGVLFFGWSLITILVLYWIENGIVGFWNVPKIALARGSIVPRLPDMSPSAARAATLDEEQAESLRTAWRRAQELQAQGLTASGSRPLLAPLQLVPRAGLAIFFLVHYGIFWLVHGIFVFSLPELGSLGVAAGQGVGACEALIVPQPGEFPAPADPAQCANPFGVIAWGSVLVGALALFLSHGASFLLNFLGNGEFEGTSPARQMAAPYGRVIVLHLTILLGAFVVAFLGAPVGALLLLVGLKTAFDLNLHRREHARPT